MKRRTIVSSALAGLGAGMTSGAWAKAAHPMQRLETFGVQLSTLTPLLLADFPGTLAKMAQIGYPQVEFSALGFLGRGVAEVAELLAANNLSAPVGRLSPHMPASWAGLPQQERIAAFRERAQIKHLLHNVEANLEDVKHLGQKTLVLPALMPDQFQSLAQVRANIELIRAAGKLCAGEGVRFGYHNHDWELRPLDGVVPYELMLAETDPDEVTFQLDAYWIRKGGGDLFDYLARFPGRFSSAHMKDIDDAGGFADVGAGNIDFPRFTKTALAAGIEHFFVERDNPPDPLGSVTRSYAYLRAMRF